MGWVDWSADAETIDVLWPDAPSSSTVAQVILDAAQIQCEAFAPALADGAEVPTTYKVAVVMQAAALHKAGFTGGADQIGGDFPVRVFPMDWTVKALLRPQPGTPGVF